MNRESPVASEQYSNARYEEDQGDCLQKTKQSKVIHFVVVHGNKQFQRTKLPNKAAENMKKMADTVKWNHFCKLQIAYSATNTVFHSSLHDDGIAGNFEILLLVYQDISQCRVNLTEVFNQMKGSRKTCVVTVGPSYLSYTTPLLQVSLIILLFRITDLSLN